MIAKARVAQLTGLPSITAAAEGPVTFGCFFYRWKARLLRGWGSGWAQGTGGRVRTPAPTKYGKLSGLSVGAGPRPARRMKGKISRYGGRGKPLPDSFTEALPDWVGEALGPPAGGCACQESTLIRLASGQTPSPFQGEGLSGRVWDPPLRRMTKTVSRLRRGRSQTGPRAAKGRPYGGNGPVALARQSQAQFLNRTIRNFPSNRPPKAAPNAKPSVAGLRWRGHSPAGERFGAQPPEGRLLARRWSDGVSELCPVRAKRGIRNPRRRSGPVGI